MKEIGHAAPSTAIGDHPLGSGRTVPIRDGRKLYVVERGRSETGAPTIVFEAGLAAPRSYWGLVQPDIARCVRAVVYDRAGLGRSDPDPEPRTIARMADDLGDLLDALGDGPFILVAHSGGALIARAAAIARPGRIAGLVLVDPTDEGCDAVFSPWFRRFERLVHHASVLLAWMGLLEPLSRKQLSPLPETLRREFANEAFTPAAMRTRGAELKGLVAAMNDLRHRPASHVPFPVTVISGALTDPGMSRQLRAAFTAAHARRAQLSAVGRHIVAEHSGHLIPLDEPEVLIAEIMRLAGR